MQRSLKDLLVALSLSNLLFLKGWSLFPNPSAEYIQEDAGGTQDVFFLLKQPLPITGRLGLLRRAGESAVKAKQAKSRYALVQLRSDLRSAFYELLVAQQREETLRKAVPTLEELVRISRAREQDGESSTFDRLKVEKEWLAVHLQRDDAEILRTQKQARLAAFFAPTTEPHTLTVKATPSNTQPLPPLPQLVTHATEVRADYQAGNWQSQRFAFEQQAATRLRIPQPTLSAGVKTVRTLGWRDNGYVFSLAVPLPLANRGQAETAQATAEKAKIDAEQTALRQQIATEVTAAYATVNIRRRMVASSAAALSRIGSELARIAQIAYHEGAQDILSLLDAHRTALQSQLQLWELQAATKQAEIELERAVGEEILP